MKHRSLFAALLATGVSCLGANTSTAAEPTLAPSSSKWKVEMLTLDANEGCAIGDLNGDGKNDVVAGRNWYAAPDFKPRPLRTIEDWNGYVESNGDFLMDVDLDGLLDVVAGSFIPTQVHWYQNPGAEGWRLGQTWKKHLLVDTKASQNEAQLMADLDGDGRPEWVVNSWNKQNPTVVWRFVPREATKENPAKFELVGSTVGKEGNQHGLGVGDINNDGRVDVLIGSGWYEQPTEKMWDQPWQYHADWNIQGSIPMLVKDVDGDGLNDLLVGAGHDYGLYWWKRKKTPAGEPLAFDSVVIDKSFSQPHALALCDLDGDGVEDLISGKRYFAHNGGDPGGKDMPEIHSYHWNGKEFVKRAIEQGHIGVGLQIATGDLNGDGRADIAVAGKSGTYILLNLPQ
ncbi:FG-GAP repeat protein [Pirellula sp. SH-Sr6A]|uniref:FG-GAP repeat domain-containing protein n=1 Tax=Pirellula sp. SH-Sr6A TaxID=1632865 RepID=UPI00078C8174|nr:VCBS repeat-containing protein [Pirellula sp. SH-Sr6A]AMV32947.1 FG-GAP repeat protein [Pirellula sp. SH-Sr6A]